LQVLAAWGGWAVLTAVAAVLAGVATTALVIVTWMLVDRTQAMAKTAQRQLLAGAEPLLVDVEHNHHRTGMTDYQLEYEVGGEPTAIDESWVAVSAPHDEQIVVSVPMRNVGSGVAVVCRAQLVVGDLMLAGDVTRRFIPSGELGRFEWQWATGHKDATLVRNAIATGRLRIIAEYSDFSAQRTTTVRVELRQRDGNTFRVRRVDHELADLESGLDRPPWALTLESISLSLLGARIALKSGSRDGSSETT
jgi:hypothetical protein